jgi:secreted PhoX family phosphatase
MRDVRTPFGVYDWRMQAKGAAVHPSDTRRALLGGTIGPAFRADGRTLFVNIYNPGYTFTITGPWRRGRR